MMPHNCWGDAGSLGSGSNLFLLEHRNVLSEGLPLWWEKRERETDAWRQLHWLKTWRDAFPEGYVVHADASSGEPPPEAQYEGVKVRPTARRRRSLMPRLRWMLFPPKTGETVAPGISLRSLPPSPRLPPLPWRPVRNVGSPVASGADGTVGNCCLRCSGVEAQPLISRE